MIYFFPKTKSGTWSVGLIIFAFAALALMWIFVSLGERGGEAFFSNLKLALPWLLMAVSGTLALFAGIASIIKSKERSILVFFAILVGLLIFIFLLGEFIYPH